MALKAPLTADVEYIDLGNAAPRRESGFVMWGSQGPKAVVVIVVVVEVVMI